MLKKWIEKIVSKKIEEVVGKKPKESAYVGMFSFKWMFGEADDESKGTGVFRDIDRLENKVAALEKYLGVEYKEESKEFKGYKKAKKANK